MLLMMNLRADPSWPALANVVGCRVTNFQGLVSGPQLSSPRREAAFYPWLCPQPAGRPPGLAVVCECSVHSRIELN